MNSASPNAPLTLPNQMNDPIYEEREVLAGMIATADTITDDYLSELTAADFLYYQHQHLFTAIAALRSNGLPVDEVTLENELTRQGTLQTVGGMSYVLDLLLTAAVHSNWRGVVHLVKAHHKRRQTLDLATQLAQSAIEDNRAEAEKALLAVQALITPPVASDRWEVVHASDLKHRPPLAWLLEGLIPEGG
jgi:replicative DNA helicase